MLPFHISQKGLESRQRDTKVLSVGALTLAKNGGFKVVPVVAATHMPQDYLMKDPRIWQKGVLKLKVTNKRFVIVYLH
jgi:hypothetical protein